MTTPRLPEHWPDHCYIRPIRTEAGGIRAFTHLAELKNPAGQSVRGFVKHFPADAHRGLFNEWFGFCALSALGVPQADTAVMRAPLMGTGPMAWCFVSQSPRSGSHGTPKQIYDATDWNQLQILTKRLLACPALPSLIAADQLISNADRNLGNLVFTGEHQFLAIDHSDILGGPDWATPDLWFEQQWSRSKLIEDLMPIQSLAPEVRAKIYAAAEVVEETFFAAQSQIREVLGADANRDTYVALNAVWWRALSLARWFRTKLELLA